MPSEFRFARYLADLPDPRVSRARRHRLDDILVITLCAAVCGADSFEEVERFGEARGGWPRRFLALPHGIPSHDTFNRVLAALDRDEFSACFARWMAGLCQATGLKPIAVDGKAVRSAPGDTFGGCLHLVRAWATENGVVLGQVAVADGGHEIAAVPERLEALDLNGALVTIGAAGCPKATVRQVRDQGGDDLVAVKGNQPALQAAVRAAFDRAAEAGFAGCDMSESADDGHGRHEERYATVIRDPEGLPPEWADVGAVVVVGREREAGGEREYGPLLPHQPATAGGRAGRVRPGPLGGGERAALVPRCRLPGGREPDPGHERRGQPGGRPPGGRLAAEAG